ncbi:hypothetical protein RRG08_023428 [Elysia crispata]|uniref:Uncharacterized protein n=1 Tax=Elysia crispata TaxID=231223 RepID=A0AAE0YDZ4_9GAST|nr:hypothetical protein RRG08_023428 [Elysia crispata]
MKKVESKSQPSYLYQLENSDCVGGSERFIEVTDTACWLESQLRHVTSLDEQRSLRGLLSRDSLVKKHSDVSRLLTIFTGYKIGAWSREKGQS